MGISYQPNILQKKAPLPAVGGATAPAPAPAPNKMAAGTGGIGGGQSGGGGDMQAFGAPAPIRPGGQMVTQQATQRVGSGTQAPARPIAPGTPYPPTIQPPAPQTPRTGSPTQAPDRPMQPGTPRPPTGTIPPVGGTPTVPQMPAGPAATPTTPGVGINPINPEADMRGSNILPQQTQRLATSQGQSDAASSRVAGFDTSAKIGGYQDQFTGPDTRSQIAKDRLAQFDLDSEPLIRDRQRAAIQNAFRGGRGGMGDEMVNALNPFTDYLTRRAALSHGLAADTAEGEISDRMGVLDRAIGVTGQERAGDIGTMSELERRSAGIGDTEAGYRDEYRGERDYEQLLNRQAMEDAIRERGYEDSQENLAWNRDFSEDTLAAGLNPAGTYLGAAGNYGQNAAGAYGGAGDLFAQWLARNKGGG